MKKYQELTPAAQEMEGGIVAEGGRVILTPFLLE